MPGKRPPPRPPSSPDQTLVSDEDLVSTGQRKVPPAEEQANDGATAFVRLDAVGPPPAAAPPAEEANDGATAFVRLDASGPTLAPPPSRPRAPGSPKVPPPPSAPRKGLQVQLPDEEPAAPPPPKRQIVVPPKEDKKGRRGAWWDQKAEEIPDEEPESTRVDPPPEESSTAQASLDDLAAEEETVKEDPPPDDEAGATAMVQAPHLARRRQPSEDDGEPELEPPKPAPEPAVDEYKPLPADDYGGHLEAGPPRWKRWLRRAAVASIVLFVLGVGALIGGYVYINRQIPPFETLRDYKPVVASRVVAADGQEVGQFFKERRTIVPMDQIPQVLVHAVLSAEDKDFYKHPGFNVIALVRAVIMDVLSGQKRFGASTITQQVVKTFFLTREKKITRKIKEILLSARLERNLSKDDILFLYLNQINFGAARYGVEEASRYYFGKSVRDLELGEAALLAGIPQSPTRLNPRRHPENAKRRQKYVLGRMLKNKYITQEEHDEELARPLRLPPIPDAVSGQWYLDEVRRQLVAQFGETAVDGAGLTIDIAMDPRLQAAAEQAVRDGLRAVDKRQGWRGAQAHLDPEQLVEARAALGRRASRLAPMAEFASVFDLTRVRLREDGAVETAPEPVEEDDPAAKKGAKGAPKKVTRDPDKHVPLGERVARAAVVRPLVPNEVYGALVTHVNPREARVELFPGLEGVMPFTTMQWARPFKPEGGTPRPGTANEVLTAGDIVQVRVARVQQTRDATGIVRVQRVEFALEQTPLVQGAFAAIDLRTRGVSALVGGFDAVRTGFNRATQARRQPGSAFKAFLFAAALDTGKYTPATRVDDSPEVITDPWSGKSWKPQNFEKDEFAGSITLRKAFAESKNTVAVKLLIDLGLDKVRALSRAAGLTSEIPQSYTAALGTGEVQLLEITNAYATLASLGRKADPILIRKVVSRDGNTMFSTEARTPEPSMKPETAYLAADLMRSVIHDPDGTAHSLSALGRPAGGKTGTASDHRDAWFVGFTPSLAAGAWVGFDDHAIMGPHETGGHAAGPIWLQWMRAATAGQPIEDWIAPPPGVAVVRINRNTGALTSPDDPFGVREVFMAGTEPTDGEGEQGVSQEQFYRE